MRKVVRSVWELTNGGPFAIARILSHDIHPEGMDVDRIKFVKAGTISPESEVGHLVSVLWGSATLSRSDDPHHPLQLQRGVHIYLPPGLDVVLDAKEGTELLRVSSSTASQARGKDMLLRDETFVAACAAEYRLLRWAITPQYLSRRIFLHHDPTLLSKSGHPVSWFHTTMFDVGGLPDNEDGEPVFKMSYNSRTEFNVCYDVKGACRVRMALHPYRERNQAWTPWQPLDSNTTYHLNEAAGSPEEERRIDESTKTEQLLRNKHEVSIVNGHVSLFCMFDPAPCGMENHRPGEYSDYEPLSTVLGTNEYKTYQREVVKFDEMVDQLSLAKARGELGDFRRTPIWEIYLQGREAQIAIEDQLTKTLAEEGKGRELVLERWMQSGNLHHEEPVRRARSEARVSVQWGGNAG